MADDETPKALAEEILADARRQAERKRNRARKRAERIVSSARRKVDGIRKEALAEAEERVEHETRRILADVPHQDQVRTLAAREAAIDGMFQQALRELAAETGAEAADAVVRLAADAIGLLDGERFMLEVRPADAESLGVELSRRVPDEVARRGDRQVTVEVVSAPDLDGGGVQVRTADGSRLVDQSYATRLRRLGPRLREETARIVFGEATE
jgi:vacuolar-type H+-ATPase subunit E/Vma4